MIVKNIFYLYLFLISLTSLAQFPSVKDLSTGQGTIGGLDPNWTVSPLIPLTSIPTNPDVYTYTPAKIITKCASTWVTPSALAAPINNGNWIMEPGSDCSAKYVLGGYQFFRLKLNLPAVCDGINIANVYVINFSGYVDDKIENVYVNGVVKNNSGGSYSISGNINFTLKDSWKVGENVIDVLVKNNVSINASHPNPYGLLLVADPVKSANTDLDQDGIPDLTDPCPCQKWSDLSTCSPSCANSGITTSTQPGNQTGCAGSYISFTANANASKFQWKESRDNGVTFTSINNGGVYSGAQSSTLKINGITDNYNGYIYKCFFLSTSNCIDSSNTAAITITPVQTTTTKTIPICKGGTTTLTATTTPLANYSYIWQVPAGVTNPGNVNSFITSVPGTYTVNVFAPNNLLCNSDFETYSSTDVFTNYDIPTNCWQTTATDNKIEVWTSSLSVPSYSGAKFIEINATQAASIYQDFSGIAGAQLAISFAHRGREGEDVIKVEIGPPTGPFVSLGNYPDGISAWGYYTTNYTLPTTGKYRLLFTAVSTTITSSGCASKPLTCGNFLDAISIKTSTCASTSKEFIVNEIPLPIAQITGADTVCKNDASPSLTFTGSNGTAPYIFTYTINGGTNQTITSTGNITTLPIPTTTVGESTYKLISVKEGSSITCSQALTSTLTYKILPNSVGGTLSADQTICSGSAPSALSLSGHVGTITKWQSNEPPSTSWTDIANNTASYTPSALTKTTKFRVEVKNDICTPVYSNEITKTVDELSVGGTITSDQNICETATPATVTLAGHTGQIKKWQFSADPYSSWSDLTNTTASYSPPKLTKNTKYRAVVKNGVCPEENAVAATITIKPIEKLNITCGARSTTDVEFTWTNISDETTYDYTYSIDGGAYVVGQALINATSVTIPVTGDGQSVEIKNLTATGATCAQAESKICTSKTCLTPVTDPILDLNVCSGGTISIPPFTSLTSPNTPTYYKWRVNYSGFSILSSGTQSVPFNAATSTLPASFLAPTTTTKIIATFSVNALDATCVGPTMTFNVIVHPLPVLNISNDGPICSGERAIQLAENSGNATSWQWSTSTTTSSFSASTISNPTISNAKNSEVVTVEATDVNSCKNKVTTTLVVYALPNIDAGNITTICSGNPFTLSGMDVAGIGGITFTWDYSVLNGIPFTPTDSKIFTLTGEDTHGCKNTDQVTINVTKTPKINLINESLCSGTPLTINPTDNLNGQIVPPTTTYTWSVNAPTTIGGANTQTSPATAPFTVTLTNNSSSSELVAYAITANNSGCTSNFTANINVAPLPAFTPSAQSKCVNDPLYVKANLPTATQLTWSGPNSFASSLTSDDEILVTNTATTAHEGPYTITVKDQNGCENTKIMTVSLFTLPNISGGGNRSICLKDALTLKATGGSSYQWNNSVIDGISFLLNVDSTFTVIGTDANGCKNTDVVKIKVNKLPDFTLSVNDTCEKTDLIFNADLSINPSTAGIQTAEWKGPNSYTASGLTTTIPNVSLADSGSYYFSLTDNNNCVTTKSIKAIINPIDSIFFADIKPKCTNDSSFQLPTPNILGGTWSSSDITSIVNKTTGVFAPTKSIPDVQNKVAITYTTTTITPARKCPSSKTKDVFVNPIPDSNFYATKTTVCIDDTFHLIVKKPVINTVYTWDLGNGEIINKDSPFNYTYSKDGDFTVKLEATLANCKVSKTLVDYIHVVPKPTLVNFSQSETEIDFYHPEILFTSFTNGKYVYWNFGDGTISTEKNPTHIFPDVPGEYMVQLTASNIKKDYCSNTIKHSIFMPEPLILFIPNTFTPNSDEFNNVFKPVFTSGFDPYSYSFYIYNRWGELLFESHDAQIGWDGTYGNKIIESETFIWKLEFKEKLKDIYQIKSGHVNIIR